MKIQIQGIFNFNIQLPKKDLRLNILIDGLDGPSEQLWSRQCILIDYLMDGKEWKVDTIKGNIFEGFDLSEITIKSYEIINNQNEKWNVELKTKLI